MPGVIVGFYGQQRSGKTLAAYLIAERWRKEHGIPVYSNIKAEGWNFITSLEDMPINREPKTLLLDEAYYFLDSRDWKHFGKASLFFNTIGKMNVNLMFTGITIEDMELRLKSQHWYVFLVKKDEPFIYYRMLDVNRQTHVDMKLELRPELFKGVTYDTNRVSSMVTMDVTRFLKAANSGILDDADIPMISHQPQLSLVL